MCTDQEPGLHDKTNQTICVLCFWLRLGLALVEGGGTGGTGATRLLKLKTDQPSYTHAKSRDQQNNRESSGISKVNPSSSKLSKVCRFAKKLD